MNLLCIWAGVLNIRGHDMHDSLVLLDAVEKALDLLMPRRCDIA